MTQPDPSPSSPLPTPPQHLFPPLIWDMKSPASARLSSEPVLKTRKMSHLCLSAGLLVLLGILAAGTQGQTTSSPPRGKSRLTRPLRVGAGRVKPLSLSLGPLGKFNSRNFP